MLDGYQISAFRVSSESNGRRTLRGKDRDHLPYGSEEAGRNS
jgi:hypothetical protein